jgi:hypothetical protein
MAHNFRIAGVTALLAGTAWIAWAAINIQTHGGLDAGPPTVSASLALVGRLLTAAFNLFLVPAALALWSWLKPERPALTAVVSLCGLASLLLWACGAITERITPHVEVTYLALSGVWWCGLGVMLWSRLRFLGAFTLILGVFALWDSLLTALWPLPFGLYLTAAPKLPLSMAWDFLLGLTLWRAARTKRFAH